MNLPIALATVLGAGWGLIADRVGARWPAHDDGSVRQLDWRSAACVVAGTAGSALLVDRYADHPAALVFLAPVVVVLVVLFATDLDQRLLPDLLTFPIAAYALLGFVTGSGPFVRTPGDLLVSVIAAIALPGALYLLSIPFGAGAIGIGDLKLLLAMGLLVGPMRLVAGVMVGAIAAAIGILVLILIRRITLKSYVPYGPFLIIGALWAITVTRTL